MKKQYQVRTNTPSTVLAYDTLAGVKSLPSAKEIQEFDENTNAYHTVCRKIDGVWINEDQQPLFS